MALLTAVLLGAAIVALGVALVGPDISGTVRGAASRWHARQVLALQQARVSLAPGRYALIAGAAPVVGIVAGWWLTPPCAVVGLLAGLAAPRTLLAWLVHRQAERADGAAPRFLQAMVAQLSAGATYFEGLRQSRLSVDDPWLRQDLDGVVHEFMLDVPLETALRHRRAKIRSHNFGLIWDTLAICVATGVPTGTANGLLAELAGSVQFNVQLQHEIRARSAGQRLQVWLLAFLVPGLYLYLRLLNPDLLSVLDDTGLGHYVLLPVAVLLEVLGLYLSIRLTRVRG